MQTTLSQEMPVPRLRGPAPDIRHFNVGFINTEGTQLASALFSFEANLGESTSVLPYRITPNKRVLIGLTNEQRAGIAARSLLPVIRDGEKDSSLLGLRVNPGVPSSILPGPFVPSAGSSCELSHLYPVLLDERAAQSDPSLIFKDAQDILTDFLSGIPCDTRVLLAALRLADSAGIRLECPLKISRETFGTACGDYLKVLTASQLATGLLAKPELPELPYGVTLSEAAAPASPFLKILESPLNGSAVTMRKGVDAVDVGAYVWVDGEICPLLKRGIRPSIAIQSLLHSGAYAPTDALALEGIAESLEGETSIEQVGNRAAQGVREEAGLEPIGTPVYVGSSYPSSHLHTERVFDFIVEVNPSRKVDAAHTIDERIDIWCAPARDIIKLCEQGVIKDPRLEINARLLALATMR